MKRFVKLGYRLVHLFKSRVTAGKMRIQSYRETFVYQVNYQILTEIARLKKIKKGPSDLQNKLTKLTESPKAELYGDALYYLSNVCQAISQLSQIATASNVKLAGSLKFFDALTEQLFEDKGLVAELRKKVTGLDQGVKESSSVTWMSYKAYKVLPVVYYQHVIKKALKTTTNTTKLEEMVQARAGRTVSEV